MPAINWYGTSSLASVHQEMSETDPGTEAYASPVTGWVVSTGAGPDYAPLDSQTEQAATTFLGSPVEPDGSINTTNGDCLRSTNTYNGTFDTGNWTCTLGVRAQTIGGAQDGRAAFRVFSGPNADGSGATERTAARQVGSGTLNLDTTVTQASTATFSVTGWTTSGAEYVFVQVGWERQGAGGMTTADVNLRVGNASGKATRVTSANFTAAAPTGHPAMRRMGGIPFAQCGQRTVPGRTWG
jgi:hypothetical protein